MPRILLINDDIAEISVIKRVLLRAGHQAFLATNSSDALAAVLQEMPQLAIISATCENGEGLTLAQRLAEDTHTASLPIILLGESADAPHSAAQLPRPIDPAQLAGSVQTALQARGSAAAKPVVRIKPGAPAPGDQSREPDRRNRPAADAERRAAADALRQRAEELRRAATAQVPPPPPAVSEAIAEPVSPPAAPEAPPSAPPDGDPRAVAEKLAAEELLELAQEEERREADAQRQQNDGLEEQRRAKIEEELSQLVEEADEDQRSRIDEERSQAEEEQLRAKMEQAHEQELAAMARAAEEEALKRTEAEAAARAAEAANRAAEEEARRQAEIQARAREEEARRQAEEQAEIAAQAAEEEARRQAEEQAKIATRTAEEAARRRAEAESQARAQAEARRQAEEQAKIAARTAEEAARRRAEAESQARAQAEARRQAEAQAELAARAAEEEARRRAEVEAQARAQAEARHQAEEQARRRIEAANAARAVAEEARRRAAAEAAARAAAEEARWRAQMEELAQAEAEAHKRAEEEEEAAWQAEEKARQETEERAATRNAEEEAIRQRVRALAANRKTAARQPPPPEPPPPPRLSVPEAAAVEEPNQPTSPDLPAPPRELASGNLGEMPMPRLLTLAANAALTGRLDFGGENPRSLYLEDGRVVGATSAAPHERVEEVALRLGLLTREQHRLATSSATHLPSRRAALLLLERGWLKPTELTPLARRRTEEVVFALFGEAPFSFRYAAARVSSDERIALDRGTLELAVDGVRRKWLDSRLDSVLGGSGSLLAPGPLAAATSGLGLTAGEQRTLELADGLRTLDEIVADSPLEALSTRQILAAAVMIGVLLLRYRDAGSAAEEAPSIDLVRVQEKLDQVRRADYFAILGLARRCTPYEIREAAERLVTEFDTQRFAGISEPGLVEKLAEIRRVVVEAREVLSDDALRREYLAALRDEVA